MTHQNHTKSILDNKMTSLIATLITRMKGLQYKTATPLKIGSCAHTSNKLKTLKWQALLNYWQLISETVTGNPLVASLTRSSLRHFCVSNDELSVTGMEGAGLSWAVGERDGGTKYGERKRKEWGMGGGRRNGVLPPRRLSERITQEQQQQQQYDDERSIPTIFFKAALLKYWTRFIIKNNQCGILRRNTAGAENKQSRTEESSA